MHFSCTVQISAPSKAIYELYSAVSNWPAWDPEVERASISGPFARGTVGTLKPKGGPESKIELIEVSSGKSFKVRCRLPLCEMTFDHALTGTASLTTATHSVSFTGPLAPVFGFLIGRGIKNTLPATLNGLKRAAETGQRKPSEA